MSKFWLAASVRKIRFQSAIAWSFQKIAASVWSAVRVALVSEPSSLTSLKSSVYAALVSAFGPSVRSISALGTRNGRTFPTHGAGSFRKLGGVGRQMPGACGYGVGEGPKRPSFSRAVSIALAVASPMVTPAALDPGGLSGRPAMYVSYCGCSVGCCTGNRPGRSSKPTSTRKAAVAVAASFESVGFEGGWTRYGWWPRSIALTASYTAPCTIAKLSADTGGGCPAVVTIAVEAIRFQSVTASAHAIGGDASATSDSATRSGRIGIFLN